MRTYGNVNPLGSWGVKDTMYLDRINGTIEAFTYSEGRRYFMGYPKGLDRVEIARHFKKRHFRVVNI